MDKKIGFIGCGKMAKAIITGLIHSKLVLPEQIVVSACTTQSLDEAKEAFGIQTTLDNNDVVSKSDWVILAVGPGDYEQVISEIKESLSTQQILISVAIGRSTGWIERQFGQELKIVRAMPNLASRLGAGMTAIFSNARVTETELVTIIQFFASFGRVETFTNEEHMDAVVSISASSPAYTYVFIEAMADGGVRLGLPRDQAYRLASQAVLGAAKTVLESEQHPGVLKDQVCSPGGSTISALATLEDRGFRGAIISAMKSCTDRVKDFSDFKK